MKQECFPSVGRQYNIYILYFLSNSAYVTRVMADSRFSRRSSRTEVKASQGDRKGEEEEVEMASEPRVSGVEYASVAPVSQQVAGSVLTHSLPA